MIIDYVYSYDDPNGKNNNRNYSIKLANEAHLVVSFTGYRVSIIHQ